LVGAAVNRPNNTYNQSGKFGVGSMSGGEIKDHATVAGEINEAATVIRQILEQSSATCTINNNKRKNIIVAEAIETIESTPELKAKIINILQSGQTETFKETINHPLVNIFLTTIKDWQDVE